MKAKQLIAILFIVFTMTACVQETIPRFTEATVPDLEGKIIDLALAANSSKDGIVITVIGTYRGNHQAEMIVTVPPKTYIFKSQNGDYKQVTYDVLLPGQEVKIFFTGWVLESSPARATASEILIIATGEGQ